MNGQLKEATAEQAPSWYDHEQATAWANGWNAARTELAKQQRAAADTRPAPEYDKLAPLDPRD